MNRKDKLDKTILRENLLKLNKQQLKLFYGILVHYWVTQKAFISNQNFLNLWCGLNLLCSEVDESFPDPYDDHRLIKSYCQAHPYYFIDILSPELTIKLFCEHFDDRLDVLATVANKLLMDDLKAAYEYCNKALCSCENIDNLVTDAEEHLKAFS